ncbi:trafficking protein particle complex subunit 9-like isoform X2 [Babylonia areolata]|uniref:trafficking protein particle complex subunit 9-like isoform X2 n=1 Tax=Babylonia areolata TaxID=304850 RepID=UPI003FD13F27
MSLVDYGQTADDHQSLLVLVRPTGSHLPAAAFNRLWERIRALSVVHVQGQGREVAVRYKRFYPRANNDWGDFQAHRKVLGLVSVGRCVDHEEFADLFENYKKVKEDYSSTIINSRLIIFGMNTDGSPLEVDQPRTAQTPHSTHPRSHGNDTDSDPGGNSEEVGSGDTTTAAAPRQDVNNSRDAEKSDSTRESETPTTQASKAMGRTDGDGGAVTILRAGRDAGGSKAHQEGVGSRTGQEGEGRKGGEQRRPHSNSLTKESTGSEVVFYPSTEHCFDLEDRLKEFVTSLFFVLEGKRLERTFERSDRLMLLCAPFEKKDYIGVDTDTKSFKKKCMGRLRKHLGDLCLQAGLPGEAILHYQTSLDLLRSVNDFLWMGACYEGLCSASVVLTKAHSKPAPALRRNQSFSVKRGTSSPDLKHKTSTGPLRQQGSVGSFANGVDHLEQETALHCLNPDDIIEKYKEAITNYSKYKNSAMVEMEASLKACRVLIYQRKFLQASDFLQNVVYINLTSSEEDKIQRYSTLSSLYGQIGFRRKEAFFKRVAAMQCVSPGSNPAWHQCYQLLLKAVEGYNISLDPRQSPVGENKGWPVIQHRVLHELVYTARRMGNPQLAVRHSTLLLHTQYPHLSGDQQKEAVCGLETLTAKCQGVPQPLSTDTGIILPPVHLNTLPSVRNFKLLSPPPHLRPVKMATGEDNSPGSIFIYTPLSLGQSHSKGDSCQVDFEWVAEDMCEVQLQLFNPLAVEIRLLYMGLLTEGLDVEVFPASPHLPPHSPLTVKLLAKPQAAGTLRILGYDTQVFGVHSHCRLRDMPSVGPSHYQVEVVPALPQVALSCSLPKAVTFASSSSPEGATVVANAATLLYAGQSQDCVITLHNDSSYPVTSLSLKLDARNDTRDFTDRMFQWSEENIQSQLPLQPGAQLCIALCLYAHSDFLLPPVTSPDVTSSSISSRSHTESSDKGTQSLEAVLCVEYTGGPGEGAGYCRRCSLAVTVDILPSLYITNWDVLPADSGRGVSLVLDVLNASSHQTDVQCDSASPDPSPPVIIESQQCRRIAVTIPRVSFPEQEEAERFESRIPFKYRSWRTPDFHSQFLSSFVDLVWSMPAAEVKGKVSVDYLKWTEEQLDCIRQADVTWEVQVNDQHYTAPDLMTFPCSLPVTVHVALTAAKECYQDVTLTVRPGQDGGQGEGRHLDPDMFLCLGSQAVSVPVLGPDEPLHHQCSFLFLCPGRYRFHITCTAWCRHGHSDGDSALCWSCLPVPEFSVWSDALPVL